MNKYGTLKEEVNNSRGKDPKDKILKPQFFSKDFLVLQTFTNEDHLTVHKLKHQMSLTLSPGGNKFLFPGKKTDFTWAGMGAK